MDFSFDIRGYLKPYGKNEIKKEDLKTGFVDPFDEASSRKRLYQGYLKYNEDLQSLLNGQKYIQWIDGSFISTQINPRDIDLVSLIDYRFIEKYELELKRFLNKQGKDNYESCFSLIMSNLDQSDNSTMLLQYQGSYFSILDILNDSDFLAPGTFSFFQ